MWGHHRSWKQSLRFTELTEDFSLELGLHHSSFVSKSEVILHSATSRTIRNAGQAVLAPVLVCFSVVVMSHSDHSDELTGEERICFNLDFYIPVHY